MSATFGHPEMDDLLAAYALDAVEGEEAERVELHLRECPRCRAELTELRETASLLAAGHAPAPMHIWDSIVAGMEEAPPMQLLQPMGQVVPLRRAKTVRTAVVAIAAAAAVVIGVLGAQVAGLSSRLERQEAALDNRRLTAALLSAQGNPEARRADLRSSEGVVLAHVVLEPDGTGFLWTDGLPPAPGDRTYQLWAVVGSTTVSAGVLGPEPGVAAFKVVGDVVGVALSEERRGGVVVSESAPVASGLVRPA